MARGRRVGLVVQAEHVSVFEGGRRRSLWEVRLDPEWTLRNGAGLIERDGSLVQAYQGDPQVFDPKRHSGPKLPDRSAMRTCLARLSESCMVTFMSDGPGNRRCPKCAEMLRKCDAAPDPEMDPGESGLSDDDWNSSEAA